MRCTTVTRIKCTFPFIRSFVGCSMFHVPRTDAHLSPFLSHSWSLCANSERKNGPKFIWAPNHLMIDESCIVSVNKLDYLLKGTRANIWPQIDAHSAIGCRWIIDVLKKLEKFHRHLPCDWTQMVLGYCLALPKLELLALFFPVLCAHSSCYFVVGISFLWFPHETRATDGPLHHRQHN